MVRRVSKTFVNDGENDQVVIARQKALKKLRRENTEVVVIGYPFDEILKSG